MTKILTYHPKYEHKAKLQAILHEGDPYVVVHEDGYVTPETRSDRLKEKDYTPSVALRDFVDITPLDVMESFLRARLAIGSIIDEITEDLIDKVTIGPGVVDYIKSKDLENGGDQDLSYEFEDFHSDRMEGNTKAEVLPVLIEFQKELDTLEPFLEEHIGPIGDLEGKEVQTEDGEYYNPELEEIREKEEAQIQDMVNRDKEGLLDFGELHEGNHVRGFLYNRFEGLVDFVLNADNIFNESLYDHYRGAVEKVARTLKQFESLRDHFQFTNQKRFNTHVQNAADAYLRMKRLVTHNYKRRLLTEITELQKQKLKAREYVDVVQMINPAEEDDPFNIFLVDTLNTIEDVRDESDRLVEDLYKITELERIQNEDYIESIRRKNEIRQLHGLMENIDTLPLDEGNIESDILRLLP